MKYKKGKFTILHFMHGKREVDGYVSNVFGLHKAGRAGWRITHLKSGVGVCAGYFKTKKQAQEWAEKFYVLLAPEQWDQEHLMAYRTPEVKEQLTALNREAKRI